MSKNTKSDIKKILKLVTEIHSKVLEPSTTNKVTTGIKNIVNNTPNILKQLQQRGGKNKTRKNIVRKNKSRKKI
jgi:DNA replication protein DnaD